MCSGEGYFLIFFKVISVPFAAQEATENNGEFSQL